MDPPLPQPQTPPRPTKKNHRHNGRRTPVPSSNSTQPAAAIEKQPVTGPNNTIAKLAAADKEARQTHFQGLQQQVDFEPIVLSSASSDDGEEAHDQLPIGNNSANANGFGFQNECSSSNSRLPIGLIGNALKPAATFVGVSTNEKLQEISTNIMKILSEATKTPIAPIQQASSSSTTKRKAANNGNSREVKMARQADREAKLAELDNLLKGHTSAQTNQQQSNGRSSSSTSSIHCMDLEGLERQLAHSEAELQKLLRMGMGTSNASPSVQNLMKSAAQVNAGAGQQIISPPPNDPSTTMVRHNNQINASNSINTSQRNVPPNPLMGSSSTQNIRFPTIPFAHINPSQYLQNMDISGSSIFETLTAADKNPTNPAAGHRQRRASGPAVAHMQQQETVELVPDKSKRIERQVKTPENSAPPANSNSTGPPNSSPLSLMRKMTSTVANASANPNPNAAGMPSASAASSQQPTIQINHYQATKNEQNMVAGFLVRSDEGHPAVPPNQQHSQERESLRVPNSYGHGTVNAPIANATTGQQQQEVSQIQRQPSLNDFTLDAPGGRDFYSFETTTMANSTVQNIPGSSHQMTAAQQAMMIRPDFLQPHPIILQQQQMEHQQFVQQFQLQQQQQAHAANQMNDYLKQVHNLYQQQFADMERSVNKKLDDLQKLVLQRVSQKLTEQEESLRTTINDVRREMTRRLLPIELQMPGQQPIQHAPVPTMPIPMGGNNAIVDEAGTSNNNENGHSAAPAVAANPMQMRQPQPVQHIVYNGAAPNASNNGNLNNMVRASNNNGHHSAAPPPTPQQIAMGQPQTVQHIVFNGPPNNFNNGNPNMNMVRAVAQNPEPAPAGMPNNPIGGGNDEEDVQFLDSVDAKWAPHFRKEGELKREPEQFILAEDGEIRKQTAGGNADGAENGRDQQQNPAEAAQQQQEAPRRLLKQEPMIAMEVEAHVPQPAGHQARAVAAAKVAAKAIMNLVPAHQPLRQAVSRQNTNAAADVQNRHDAVQKTQRTVPRTLRPRRPSGSGGNNTNATPSSSTHAMYLRQRKTPDYTWPSASGSSTPSTSSSSSASSSQQRRH